MQRKLKQNYPNSIPGPIIKGEHNQSLQWTNLNTAQMLKYKLETWGHLNPKAKIKPLKPLISVKTGTKLSTKSKYHTEPKPLC